MKLAWFCGNFLSFNHVDYDKQIDSIKLETEGKLTFVYVTLFAWKFVQILPFFVDVVSFPFKFMSLLLYYINSRSMLYVDDLFLNI